MIRRIILLASLLIIGLIPTAYAEAACQVGEGKSVKTTVSFVGNPSGSSITVNGTTLSRNAAQCTSPIASGSYTVSCDTRTETLAADSVFAPLCGSAVELGKANSSCWTCGDGSLRCSGANFALGETDDAIYLNRQSIDGGDTSQVWRVGNHPSTFTYNGVKYTHGGDLVVCTANVAGCDASNTTCQSALYPDVTTQNAPSANEVVEVVGDTVHEKIEIPETLSGLFPFLPQYIKEYLKHFVLDIWPKDDIFQSPNLDWLTNQMYQANFYPLNPKMLQDKTTHMAKLQPYSTTARLCVTDTETGEVYTAVSEQRYESKNSPPFLLRGIEGSRGLASKMTKHREFDQNFDDKPTVKIKTDSPLPCGTDDTSQNLVNEPVGTFNRNVFSRGSVADSIPWLLRVPILVSDSIWDAIQKLFHWQKTVSGYILKTQLVRSAELDCYTGHCETTDLGRVNYVSASEKQELVSSGGIVETFKPLAHTLPGPIHGGTAKQPFDSSLGVKNADTRLWGLNRTTEASIYFNCMIAPLSKQTDLMPSSLYPPTASDANAKSACSQKWEGEKSPDQPPPMSNFALGSDTATNGVPPTLGQSGAGSDRRPDGTIRNAYMENVVQQAARDAQIPACVLEAVGMIEGAYNWGQTDSTSNPAQCVPNRCGAAGPFQITIGHNGDNSDCTVSCREAKTCPNTWSNRPGTPCDITNAAKVAADILIAKSTYTSQICGLDKVPTLTNASPTSQESSIRRAACGYYGSNAPQSSLVYNGKQISYPDFVVEHCRLFPQGQTVTSSTRR